jgi:hypothetical protein
LRRRRAFLRGQRGDRLHQRKTGLNGALRVVFVRVRIAEEDYRAVAMVPCDKAVQAGNGFVDAAPVARDDCSEIFGIELRGERGRSDEIAEQDRQLTALDWARAPRSRCPRARSHAQFCPAVSAKLARGRVDSVTGRTATHGRRSALSTEFLLFCDFDRAVTAPHSGLDEVNERRSPHSNKRRMNLVILLTCASRFRRDVVRRLWASI